jgi:beta-lactamase class A
MAQGGRQKAGGSLSIVLVALATLVNPAHTMSQPAAEFKAKFEKRLQTIVSTVDGAAGYDILDLTSGEHFTHLERETFPTASTIKLAIVYELFKQLGENRIRLDETMVLDRSKAVGGSGVLVHMGTPSLSILDYATLMVMLSDNTATNVLMDRLGMDAIGTRLRGLGLTDTKLRRHMMDTAAARRGDENVSTPAELVALLQAIQKIDPAIELLKKPKESRLRSGLPPGIAVADKPGELEGVRVDAGIVYAKNRPYVFAAMMAFLKSEVEGERAMEELSRVAYDYFNRLGEGGSLGRRMQ